MLALAAAGMFFGGAACLTGCGSSRSYYNFEDNPNYYGDGIYSRDWWADGYPHEPFERGGRFDDHRGRNDRDHHRVDRHVGGGRSSGFGSGGRSSGSGHSGGGGHGR